MRFFYLPLCLAVLALSGCEKDTATTEAEEEQNPLVKQPEPCPSFTRLWHFSCQRTRQRHPWSPLFPIFIIENAGVNLQSFNLRKQLVR